MEHVDLYNPFKELGLPTLSDTNMFKFVMRKPVITLLPQRQLDPWRTRLEWNLQNDHQELRMHLHPSMGR